MDLPLKRTSCVRSKADMYFASASWKDREVLEQLQLLYRETDMYWI